MEKRGGWWCQCGLGVRFIHKVEQKSHFGVHKVTDENREPASGLLIEMGLAKPVARSVDCVANVGYHRERLIGVVVERLAEKLPHKLGERDYFGRARVLRDVMPDECLEEAFETGVRRA